MQFCVISPAAGLGRFATLSKIHLVLSHVKNPVYREFYRQRQEAGDTLILDNGAYEGQMAYKELLDAIAWYRPKVVVLPDILLGDSHESLKMSQRAHRELRNKIDVEWMFVPQAPPGKPKNFFDILKRGIETIEPQWVGIPRALGTHVASFGLAHAFEVRATAVKAVHNINPNINVHCLGMLAGSVEELGYLRMTNCASIDSSAPVWRGWSGFKIEDPRWHELGTDCDFDADPRALHLKTPSKEKRIQLIYRNLIKCGINVKGQPYGGI